jgi:diguanylate cyclase (GGDEF)-like protein
MAILSYGISRSFSQMVESGLEREAMAKDMAGFSETLRAKNTQLQEARKQLADLAKLDELTGLRNRRGADRAFDMEVSRAQRGGSSIAVIMIDVDHFKAYNDTYGHPSGDDVLKRIAGVLRSVTARAGELAIRMGGEEFLLLLPGANQADALVAGERIRTRIMALEIEHSASPSGSIVTVSQGVAACIPSMTTEFKQLLEAADKALYSSKEGGRNTVTLSPFRP